MVSGARSIIICIRLPHQRKIYSIKNSNNTAKRIWGFIDCGWTRSRLCEAHQISKSIEIIQSNANLSHYSNFASAQQHTEYIYKRLHDDDSDVGTGNEWPVEWFDWAKCNLLGKWTQNLTLVGRRTTLARTARKCISIIIYFIAPEQFLVESLDKTRKKECQRISAARHGVARGTRAPTHDTHILVNPISHQSITQNVDCSFVAWTVDAYAVHSPVWIWLCPSN